LLEKAKSFELRAIELDSADGLAYALLGEAYVMLSDYDRGIGAFQQALILNPNDPTILLKYGGQLWPFGRAQEGVDMINRAYRLNPHYPALYDTYTDPFYAVGQYDEVIIRTRRLRGEVPTWPEMVLALSYAQLGQQKDAAAAMAELSRRFPDPSFERMLSEFGGIRDEATLAHYLDGARKAGLRECATTAELQKYPTMTHLAFCNAKRATN
jgi:tetratricopeptide (TPR) repeat protein